MNTATASSPPRLTSVANDPRHSPRTRGYAALALAANALKASLFLEERLKDGRISSRLTTYTGGVFRVRLVSGTVEYEAAGKSDDSEEDALGQAAQIFANWEYRNAIAAAGDAGVPHLGEL